MANVDTRIFGTDMRLFNYDLKVSSKGDIELLQSYDNLAQALRNRLTTEKGFLAYNASYGIDLSLFLGRKNLIEKQEMLKFAVIETIKQEPRVQTVDAIQVYQDANNPTVLYATVVVTPINAQDKLSINLVYPWYTTNQIVNIVDEQQTSTSRTTINTNYDIHSVEGVWTSPSPHYKFEEVRLAAISGTNYYLGGGEFLGRTVTLGTPLPSTFTNTYITYNRYVVQGVI